MSRRALAFLFFAAATLLSLSVFLALRGANSTQGAVSGQSVPNVTLVEPAQEIRQVKPQSTDSLAVIGSADSPTVIPVKTLDQNEYFRELTKDSKYEMRGVWIATVKNIDMPAKMDKAAFEKWAFESCQSVRDKKMNAIVFQVKPTADALYKSSLAPWSMYINGESRGVDPGYDPLGIMVETAHSMGIELHAWINPYRVTMASETLEELSPDSPARKNPSWVIGYNNQFYLNPGLPEVRKYLVDCVAEIVQNYDVDAIHMDDYFYPYPAAGIPFPDDAAFRQYGAGFTNAADWRRNNVNILVAEINSKIKEIKPYVQYGISPFGVWRNIASDPTGSNTKAGVENYDSLHADTRQWLKDGSIDYLAPQIYWSRISQAANYTVLLDWWNNELFQYAFRPVNLYVGMADYKVGTKNDEAWEKTNTEISGQIADNRAKDAITGQIHYNFSSISASPLGYFGVVAENNYAAIALTPPCPWNGSDKAEAPEAAKAEVTAEGIKVSIKGAANTQNVRKYVIYRFGANEQPEYKNEKILAVLYVNAGETSYLDKTAVKAQGYVYSVRAVSNTGIESEEAVNSAVIWY